MYCSQCGKEIEEVWVKCPYCGQEIIKSMSATNRKLQGQIEDAIEPPITPEKVIELKAFRRTGRFTLREIESKISFKKNEIDVQTKNGKKKRSAHFFKSDVQEIKFAIRPEWNMIDYFRVIIFSLLLVVTYGLAIVALVLFIKMACTQHVVIRLKSGEKVFIPICQKGDAIELLKELSYPEDKLVDFEKKKKSFDAWRIHEWIITIIWLMIATGSIYVGAELFLKTVNHMSEAEVVEADKWLSDFEMEAVIGMTETEMKEMGLELNKGKLIQNETIIFGFNSSGEVSSVTIEGNNADTPYFHGVKIGMTQDEAVQKLSDTYTDFRENSNNEFISLNHEKKVGVTCLCEDSLIKSITYLTYSEEEFKKFQNVENSNEYIFPESNSRYLTKDIILGVEGEKLRIGRNEIFARHGVVFEAEELQTYFEGKSWYNGEIPVSQFDSETKLNDFEKKNVDLIKSIENEINGANSALNFIGGTGAYISGSNAESGYINIFSINNGIVYLEIGTNELPGILREIEAEIIDNYTAIGSWGEATFTIKWSDQNIFTITEQGSSGFYEVDDVTNGDEYYNIS